MTSLVADTHAIIWHLTDPRRLGRAARRLFASADAGRVVCYLPMVSLVELWLLHERGRLRIGPAQVVEALSGHPGYSILALDLPQAMEFGALPAVPDPFDRLILAAARSMGAKLLSRDEALDGRGVVRVWD
jgi:PIN domain nuclease of toxin-antitoxin system